MNLQLSGEYPFVLSMRSMVTSSFFASSAFAIGVVVMLGASPVNPSFTCTNESVLSGITGFSLHEIVANNATTAQL